MVEIETYFDVIDEGILFDNRKSLSEAFKLLSNGRYYLKAEKVRNVRSRNQNNAMWAIPYMYFKKALHDTGNINSPSKEQVHEFCMVNCLPEIYLERIKTEWEEVQPVVNFKTGESYKEPFRLTTTKLKTIEANQYYENMQQCYAEYFSSGEEKDCIPDPDKEWKKKKKKKK